MITLISPEQFKTIPWKNGLGQTTELAISSGGSLACFDWRLSIATVAENGVFSDFSGYFRHLVLIDGEGIALQHDDKKIDHLDNLLAVAAFDGSCKTVGTLTASTIKDFNIMTNKDTYQASVSTYAEFVEIDLAVESLCFIYCLENNAQIFALNLADNLTDEYILTAGHLLKISEENNKVISIKGKNIIVIQLIAL